MANLKAKERPVIGLIAGQGRLPFLIAQGAKQAGLKVICAGLVDNADEALRREVDVFYRVPLARPGNWIRKLRRHGVSNTVMVGRVAKKRMYTPWRILRYLPDWRAFRAWYWRLRGKDKRNDNLLNALAEELASGGVILDDSTRYCKQHLADEGVMTNCKPGNSVRTDIEFGWPIAKNVAEMDIGQSIAVREREVIAVEAIEGTARMIKRVGEICKKGGWSLIKVAKPSQDMRFDVPCVGPDTIRSVFEGGGKSIVVQTGKTIIIDKPETLKIADELGISVSGKSD